jgi:branched-chain amino acid transport system substrate-binding protein
MTGYNKVQTMVQVLKQCGDDFARENVMKQANFRTTNLLSGIKINTSPIDFAPIKQVQLSGFKGDRWELFGPTLSTEIGG